MRLIELDMLKLCRRVVCNMESILCAKGRSYCGIRLCVTAQSLE